MCLPMCIVHNKTNITQEVIQRNSVKKMIILTSHTACSQDNPSSNQSGNNRPGEQRMPPSNSQERKRMAEKTGNQ